MPSIASYDQLRCLFNCNRFMCLREKQMDKSRLLTGRNLLWMMFATMASAAVIAGDAPVSFVTAPPATEVKVATEQTSFVHDMVLTATQSAPDIRVSTTDLTGPARVTPECKIGDQACSQPFTIAANALKTVRVTAKLETPGVYSMVVTAAGANFTQSFLLQVTRNAVPFPVELAASMAGASTRTARATLNVPLQETRGSGATLNTPTLTLLLRAPGKTTFESTAFKSALKLDDKALPTPWLLGKRAAPVLRLEVSELDEAGEYSGRLRLSHPDGAQTLDVPVLILSGKPWWQAALLIAIGAILSYALRAYLKTVRPRLQQQRAASVLAMDIERLRNDLNERFAPLQSAELTVVAALSDQLGAVAGQIELGESGKPQAVLDEVNAKLTLVRRWVNARRRAATLTALTVDLRNKLSQLGDQLGRRGTDVAALEISLKGVEDALDVASSNELQQRSEALAAAIAGSPDLDRQAQARLALDLQGALATLDAPDRLRRLEAIEDELVNAQIAGLAQRIRQTPEPPIGFDLDSWAALSKDALTQLDAAKSAAREARPALYRAVALDYLNKLHAGLVARVATQLRVVEAASLKEADKLAYAARAKATAGSLDTAAASLAAGKLDEAAAGLSKAGAATAALQLELTAAGLLNATDAGTAAAAPVPAGADLEAAVLSWLAGIGPRSPRLLGATPSGVKAQMVRLDLMVLVVALLVSILLGLKLLWVDNATWGSANDWVIALLWGLGLHQVANSSFEGIGGMLEKFAK